MTIRLPFCSACFVALAVASCGRLGFENLVSPGMDASADDARVSPDAFDAEPSMADVMDVALLGDAETSQDANRDRDAAPSLPRCARVLKTWVARFDADPTQADLNGDGTQDWSRGRGSFSANQIRNGQWQPSASVALLDTAPLSNFSTRTLLSLQMQHGEILYPQTNELGGAIAWMNLDNQTTSGIAVYLRLLRVSPTQQTLYLMAHGSTNPLATFALDGGLQEMTLEANPKTLNARLWVGNTFKGEWNLPRSGRGPNGDAFATVGTFFGTAVFDEVFIEQCDE